MPANSAPQYQVGALENPDPVDPGFGDWDAAIKAAQALHNRINTRATGYPRAAAIWSWPDGDCLAIIYGHRVFQPS